MAINLDHVELLTDEQVAHLRTKTPEEKMRMGSEIHRRMKAKMFDVVRREAPYFNKERVHTAVTAMLLTKATPAALSCPWIVERGVHRAGWRRPSKGKTRDLRSGFQHSLARRVVGP